MTAVPDAELGALARLGEAFGDGTRRQLYRLAVEARVPLAAGELAELTGLHRTAARAHLERLVNVGLLDVRLRRGSGGGRPSKVYVPASRALSAALPPRRYEHLARQLVAALGRLAGDDMERAAQAATEVGWAYGRDVARILTGGESAGRDGGTMPSPPDAVAWLNENGYRVSMQDGASTLMLEFANCVFREIAEVEPAVVCGFDRGLVRGLFGVDEAALHSLAAIADGDPACRLELQM